MSLAIEKIPTLFDGMCVGVTFNGLYHHDTAIVMRLNNSMSYNVYFIDKETVPLMTYNHFPNQPQSIKLKSYGVGRLGYESSISLIKYQLL